MKIKVGYMVAYDYEMLKNSLPTTYKAADKIVLAIDKDRKTFTGENFIIEPEFFNWVKEFDTENKIAVYEDSFFVPGNSVRNAETRKRNMLAKFMGEGGWHFQIDVDEYFPDFSNLVKEVRSLETKYKDRKVMFRVYWQTIFKIMPDGYFLIDGGRENFALATNYPVYEEMRYNHSIENCTLNHVALHQSFGRSEEELEKKIRNWSHAEDFDVESYLSFWKSVNRYNYQYIHDFNPVYKGSWRGLRYVQAASVSELLLKTPAHLEINDPRTHPRLQKWLPPILYARLIRN